jgi:hypothetical protein
LDLLYQACDIIGIGDICGNANRLARDRELVQLLDGLVDALFALVLARRDEDLLRAG